jgi:SAM-dependent methyltransferase
MHKILEIGCGQGFNCYVFSKKYDSQVYGIDLSKENINICKNRYPNIDFQIMSAEKMKFKKNMFNEVFALDILEHVDNLEKVIKEVNRVLNMGGKFIINVPHPKSEKWLLSIRPTYFKEIHHVRIFKNNDMEKHVLKYGFRLVKKQNKGFLQHIELYFLFKRKIDSDTQTSIGSWRDNYFTKFVHAFLLFTDPIVFYTPLKYLPLWIIGIPFGYLIELFGREIFPKSQYYEFEKIK